jgi:hypothetical protein
MDARHDHFLVTEGSVEFVGELPTLHVERLGQKIFQADARLAILSFEASRTPAMAVSSPDATNAAIV